MSVVRRAGPGEPRVDVLVRRGDPLAAIDALAAATGRAIVVVRRGPAGAAEVDLEDALWEVALATLAKAGDCRLERVALEARRGVRVVQIDRWSPAVAARSFLRPGHGPAFPGAAPPWQGEPPAGPEPEDGPAPRGELRALYVDHDARSIGVLVGPRRARRLEVLRLVPGAPRRALLRDLASAQEGDPVRLVVSRYKGRWQVEALLGQ